MKSIVFVKRVPATTTQVRVKDGTALDPTSVEFELNPYDEFAVEEALQQKEKSEDGSVAVVSFGTTETRKELLTVLAKGADKALLLESDLAPTTDGFTTASILANAIREQDFDLIFLGKQAVDRDQHGVGPAVATLLGIPCISEVVELEIGNGIVKAKREVEGGYEEVEAPLPCAITCQKGLNEPRFANLKGIMAAKKKPMEI
ncbi:MAG TPA: electron transfer flavoprotein subunit beta, partial [Planctomycetes bacterium]|nr:electron transfer flavoprotein subunit beta [Planctomycetota bacterium]